MKKIYSKPETEIIDIEPQQMICVSGDEDQKPGENDMWFYMNDTETTPESKFSGELD